MRHLRRDPRGDDRQKIEKLRASLAPMLVELNRLQAIAGVFQCAVPQPGAEPMGPERDTRDVEDPLAHWDLLVQDLEEPPVPQAATAAPAPTARRTRSVGLEPQVLVEQQTLFLPSNDNVTPRNDDVELALRTNQAKSHLHQLRELIAEKSFMYSDVIRKAPKKGVKTRARGTVKHINTQIALHCQVYSHCRSRLISLGADQDTLRQFRELKKDDIKASTAVLTPNTPGSTSLKLSWIWQDVTHHILPDIDDEIVATDAASILECAKSPDSFSVYANYSQSNVFTGCAHEHNICDGKRKP